RAIREVSQNVSGSYVPTRHWRGLARLALLSSRPRRAQSGTMVWPEQWCRRLDAPTLNTWSRRRRAHTARPLTIGLLMVLQTIGRADVRFAREFPRKMSVSPR